MSSEALREADVLPHGDYLTMGIEEQSPHSVETGKHWNSSMVVKGITFILLLSSILLSLLVAGVIEFNPLVEEEHQKDAARFERVVAREYFDDIVSVYNHTNGTKGKAASREGKPDKNISESGRPSGGKSTKVSKTGGKVQEKRNITTPYPKSAGKSEYSGSKYSKPTSVPSYKPTRGKYFKKSEDGDDGEDGSDEYPSPSPATEHGSLVASSSPSASQSVIEQPGAP
eukprot:gb/GEZN01011977.1/.p1 GENE.gb/GEZN01011977.1/~~gb/GEZN01011977.1/.p1  ORF type:complete len:228 (-),score=35.08 gb/GEZN01011977.1/:348-1031(-)